MQDEISFQQKLQEVQDFVATRGRLFSEQIEASGHVDKNVIEELRLRGYFRLTAPENLGGLGFSMHQYLEMLFYFAQLHGSLRVLIHVTNSLWRSLASKASQQQLENFVRPFVNSEKWITFTLTEPHSGSGADLKTTARRDGDDYLLNGEKWMIIFSDLADYFLLFCRLEDSQGSEGTLAFLVPRDSQGLTIELMQDAMGVTGTRHGHLYLRDCRVSASMRLGEEGDGLTVAFQGFLDPSRLAIGMTCVGLADRALQLAVQHASKRVTFGKTLLERPTIQMWIAEMATDIEAAKQLVFKAAADFESGLTIARQASMAKLFASEMLQRVTDLALQIHGGIGYFKGEMERIYRDARMLRFEEGTSETQKMTIARSVIRQYRQNQS